MSDETQHEQRAADELLELALHDELGTPRRRHARPTRSECYAVSTFVWSEWNRINDQIKNIPWWRIHLRHQARKKSSRFQDALNLLHNYVHPDEES